MSIEIFPIGLPLLVTTVLVAFFSPITRAEPFFAQRVLADVTFEVESPNASSINDVQVRAYASEGSLGQIQAEADGTVTGAEIADLNADGFPEIYIFVTSAGSGSYGSLIALASTSNKSLSRVILPSIADQPSLWQGYMGHDQFAVGERTVIRRFPIYKKGDTNAAPSGATREIHYKLEFGEAGWILRPDI